ncbi:hypothetical protein AAIB33_10580 [Microbacterium sp. AZCO]|uniref:hypothetical protein n=1 Tax=Microbacterium sp. AZCO TaxID=3142976 RepID=UPI0031F35E36
MNEIEQQARRGLRRARHDYKRALDAYEDLAAHPGPDQSPDGSRDAWEAQCRQRRDAVVEAWLAYLDARVRVARFRAIREDAQ